MASDILGLAPANFSSGTEELIAVWKTVPMIRKTSSWVKGTIHLTNNTKAEMDMFLDHLFLTNGVDNLCAYDGTKWNVMGGDSTVNVDGAPKAYFIKTHATRIYLYDVTINGVRYNSRVCYSDLPKNEQITWGLDWGSNLVQATGDATVTSATGKFQTRNIKVGDPFFITSGTNTGEYIVSSVTSNTELELTENLTHTATGSSFWVGGNWFDVRTDDGDFGNGMGETSNELMLFKKNSFHRYNADGETLRQISNVPGTTSSRSIVSTGDYVYWFHPTGIYRTTGSEQKMLSNGIEDIIASVSIPTAVVGWENQIDNTINFFIGDVETREGESITYCVASFDANSEVWSLRSYDRNIKCATNWLKSDAPKVYVGDDSDGVFELDTGYDFNNSKINFLLETQDMFPAGSETIVNFNRVRTYIDNGPDVQIVYKLIYKPLGTSKDHWVSDTGWSPLIGSQRGDRSDWYFPRNSRACGIKLRFIESSADESFLLEKFVIYYSSEANY
jgi:hypothetical protein